MIFQVTQVRKGFSITTKTKRLLILRLNKILWPFLVSTQKWSIVVTHSTPSTILVIIELDPCCGESNGQKQDCEVNSKLRCT